MSSLLALVADLLAPGRFLTAVTRVVARLAAVVALHAVDALSGHVTITTARVASLSSTTSTNTIPAAKRTAVRTASLGAVAGNVADFAALVALSGLGTASASGTAKRAFARNVTRLATLVARLVFLHGLRAVSAHVTLDSAVVALSRAFGRAVAGLMTRVATGVAGSTSSAGIGRVIHLF